MYVCQKQLDAVQGYSEVLSTVCLYVCVCPESAVIMANCVRGYVMPVWFLDGTTTNLMLL